MNALQRYVRTLRTVTTATERTTAASALRAAAVQIEIHPEMDAAEFLRNFASKVDPS